MRKLLSAILITIILVPIFVIFNPAQAATPVNGAITGNTTWRKSGSPYQLTSPVTINSGITLTIEPGVTVNFGDYYIKVNGELHARGTSDKKIKMTTASEIQNPFQQIQFMDSSIDWNDETNSGCIIENADFYQVSVVVTNSNPKISNNKFDYPFWMAVFASTGAPTITSNIITNCHAQGICVSSSGVVSNNQIEGWENDIGITAGGDAIVSNNKVSWFQIGIKADQQSTVKNNVVTNCSEAGIYGAHTDSVIMKNYAASSRIGIYGQGIIESNTAIYNKIGIVISAGKVINNNIIDNNESSLRTMSSKTIDASNNWWGTTDNESIKESIYDNEDDIYVGTVKFEPVLPGPSTTAPTDSNITSSTSSEPDEFTMASQSGDTILSMATIIGVGVCAVWIIVLAIFFARRFKKHRKE